MFLILLLKFFLEFSKLERYLYTIAEDEIEIRFVYDTFAQALEANLIGPVKYINNYNKYRDILNGNAEKDLTEFFNTEPFPYLKVRIKKFILEFQRFINGKLHRKKELLKLFENMASLLVYSFQFVFTKVIF